MKKLSLIVMLFLAMAATNGAQAVPKWLGEMFGCSWQWLGSPSYTVLPNGMCQFSQSISGSSWLWGSCGTETFYWVTDCETPLLNRPPLPEGTDYAMIAGELDVLRGTYTDIDEDWTDPEYLENNPSELQDAVEYRLLLAGYTYNSAWESLVGEPCPVPAPNLTIQEPQGGVYSNPCALVISPNPSTGEFDIDLVGIYENVTKIEVISNSSTLVVYQKTSSFSSTEEFNISTENDGYYTVVVYTHTGTVTALIQKSQ